MVETKRQTIFRLVNDVEGLVVQRESLRAALSAKEQACEELRGMVSAWIEDANYNLDRAAKAESRLKEAMRQEARLLEVAKLAYRKHHMDDSDIGWEELSDKLLDALCEAMGDGGFNKWVAALREGGEERG